jgi:hypothetical protein
MEEGRMQGDPPCLTVEGWTLILFKVPNIRDVSHYGFAIYIKKYFKAKEELWKFKYFTMQKYNLKKKLL